MIAASVMGQNVAMTADDSGSLVYFSARNPVATAIAR